MLFFSAVSPEALELLKDVQGLSILNDFYLVGGTALALRYGHRISVDLDFFTDKEFDTNIVIDTLQEKFDATTKQAEKIFQSKKSNYAETLSEQKNGNS